MRIFGKEMSARKGFIEGTHRTRSPKETIAEYSRFMPMMGITRLANITGLDRIGLPVYVAVRPNGRTLATSQGKGDSPDAAKASALMESIESWHGERLIAPLRFESYAELKRSHRVAEVESIPRCFGQVFQPDRPTMWIEGWDIMASDSIWVPHDSVSTSCVKAPNEEPVFMKSTNGLSSGNHVLEAVVHGLLEVIERDALALWSLRGDEKYRRSRQVRLDSITSPRLRNLIDRLQLSGISIAVWDVTSDIGVPTYTCTIVDDPNGAEARNVTAASGHGSHLDSNVALSRALCEAIQSRLTIISGSRDDMFPSEYERSGNREDHARMIDSFNASPPERDFAASRLEPAELFETDLQTLLAQLSSVGIRSVIAVDLSHPSIGIPVVKVVVPGLEPLLTSHYRPGLRAGRYLETVA